MSSIPYFSIARRSAPIPKAKPVYSSGSYPTKLYRAGLTIPDPKISERDVVIDHQALDLVKHRAVAHVGIAAIDLAWHDDADRRTLFLHDTNLHGRGVGAQHDVIGDVKRILHVASWVVTRDVQ